MPHCELRDGLNFKKKKKENVQKRRSRRSFVDETAAELVYNQLCLGETCFLSPPFHLRPSSRGHANQTSISKDWCGGGVTQLSVRGGKTRYGRNTPAANQLTDGSDVEVSL